MNEIFTSSRKETSDNLFQQITKMYQSYEESKARTSFLYKKIATRAIAIVLSECLDKISILKIITQEKIEPHWLEPVQYKSIQQKYGGKEENYDLYLLTNKKKLARDLSFITKLLNDTIDDVLSGGDIKNLTNSLDIYLRESIEAEDLLQEFNANKVLLRKLSYDMRKSSSRNRDILNKKCDEAFRMHELYEETLRYETVEYKYIDKWESNRTYLGNYTNYQAEKQHENTISTNKTKEELENRINHEITNFMEVIMNDMQEQIEYWMQKYDEDVDRLEKEMFELRVGKEKMEMEFASLTNLYAERQKEIELWVELRDKLREEEERERRILEATIKIQAWWRGVMVRKCLGPYRKKKKGKGKDKKGGKGGKGGKKKKK